MVGPKTLEVSAEMVRDRLNQSVYERLYTPKDMTQINNNNQTVLNKTAKTDKPANHRGRPIEFALYDLAKAKQHKLERRRNDLTKDEDNSFKKASSDGKNPTSSQFASRKFEREFEKVISNMAAQEEDWDENKLIPFGHAGSVLTTLGFLPINMSPESQDYQFFQDLWQVFDGEEREGVQKPALLYVLSVIRGFKFPEREQDAPAAEGREGIAKQAFFDEDNFVIRKGGQARLFAYFKNLYVNRLQFEGYQNKKPVPVATLELKPAPYVSEKSRKIAEAARQKHTGGEQMAADIVSYLYTKEKLRQEEKQKFSKQIAMEKDNKELGDASFKPQTLDYEFTLDQYKNRATHGDRNLDLYRTVPQGALAQKADIKTDQFEFRKGPEEFTFSPVINDVDAHRYDAEKSLETTGGIEFAQRMAKAREMQDQKKEVEGRGPLSSGKKGKKAPQPQMMGPPVLDTSSEKSKFKSSFGQPPPVVRKPRKPVTSGKKSRKPVSFFDSQKLDQKSLRQGAS